MKTIDLLTQARALITPPENWTTHTRKTPNGRGGFAFCALGAMDEVLAFSAEWPVHLMSDQTPAVHLLASLLPGGGGGSEMRANTAVAVYNNYHTHGQVLAWFDRAIARERTLEELTDGIALLVAEGVERDKELVAA